MCLFWTCLLWRRATASIWMCVCLSVYPSSEIPLAFPLYPEWDSRWAEACSGVACAGFDPTGCLGGGCQSPQPFPCHPTALQPAPWAQLLFLFERYEQIQFDVPFTSTLAVFFIITQFHICILEFLADFTGWSTKKVLISTYWKAPLPLLPPSPLCPLKLRTFHHLL